MNKALVLGAGGTIGHQLVKYLVTHGYWVRGVDIKYPEYSKSMAHDFVIADMRDDLNVLRVMIPPNNNGSFDMCFALCAQMGGALYAFSKKYDSEIIYDSAKMNLNIANYSAMSGIKKLFFSSSACAYSEKHQLVVNSPSLTEDMVWDGKPDSSYGIEKLFSEEVYDAFRRNKNLDIRIARFHNIFCEECTYKDGREKYPAAISRKVAEAKDGDIIEVFGSGQQQRSFLYISEALEGIMRLMESDYHYPINIGSEEMVSVNELAEMVIKISGKKLTIKNVHSDAIGVMGRNSDNTLIRKVLGWSPTQPLQVGMEKLYSWINKRING